MTDHFFRKKAVAVVGNSEEAAIDALALADLASKVTIVSQDEGLEMEGALLDRLEELKLTLNSLWVKLRKSSATKLLTP